ncbi:PAAR domain-containing protein [uncultured Shewanella sp.]|uniref:PAAR domain-containing protein n=1 Tax=uncultured Shewanella sp. TaxID=173975 RepID=UPI0026062F2B|nr:PAAR domain-containing protein [uncultured Shewanella sp.]
MTLAARVGDTQVCSMTTGAVPHVGGVIMSGSVTDVLIECLPAAVVGQSCVCVGVTSTIAAGSTTVLIGNMPAARMGDSTSHGGSIVSGSATVMIGG